MLTGPEHLLLQGWPMKGAGLTQSGPAGGLIPIGTLEV